MSEQTPDLDTASEPDDPPYFHDPETADEETTEPPVHLEPDDGDAADDDGNEVDDGR